MFLVKSSQFVRNYSNSVQLSKSGAQIGFPFDRGVRTLSNGCQVGSNRINVFRLDLLGEIGPKCSYLAQKV